MVAIYVYRVLFKGERRPHFGLFLGGGGDVDSRSIRTPAPLGTIRALRRAKRSCAFANRKKAQYQDKNGLRFRVAVCLEPLTGSSLIETVGVHIDTSSVTCPVAMAGISSRRAAMAPHSAARGFS